MRSIGVMLALVLTLVQTYAQTRADAEASAGAAFKLEQVSDDGWTISYQSRPRAPGVGTGVPTYSADGTGGPSYGIGKGEGLPQLPADLFSLGIPFGTLPTAELVNPVYEDFPDQLVAPQPSYRFNENGEAIAEYRPDQAAYSSYAWFPGGSVRVGVPYTYRQQRICPVRIYPFQYHPASRILRRLVKGTIVVKLGPASPVAVAPEGGPDPATGGSDSWSEATEDPYAEPAYRALVWNYDQARAWRRQVGLPRRVGLSPGGAAADPTRTWWKPGVTYQRVPVAKDGWYRVNATALSAAGGSWSQVDLPSLKVYQKGRELPVFVEADTAFSFYALRNYGDSSYYDFFTDTSMCWVTWGGEAGRRFVPSTVQSLPEQSLSSVLTVRHVEKDLDFYFGTGYYDLAQPGPVPGKGWVWDYYYPGTIRDHPFTVDLIEQAAATSIALTVRLFSTTSPQSVPDHRARIFLNDSLAGEVTFNGRTGVQPVMIVPARWLKAGSNVLRVQSVATASTVNQFSLDWFEVQFPRPLTAVNDQLLFTAGSANAPGVAGTAGPDHAGGHRTAMAAPLATGRFRLQGFTAAEILVFDLTGGRLIAPDSVGREPGGTYAAAFTDTLRGEVQYLAVTPKAALSIEAPVSKTFTNLRALAGADYIVITHRLFRAQAERLAAQRRATRAVRAVVVDVQDIYDEFNYGIASAASIKEFLLAAYTGWPGPAPSSMVILGDASWDPHRNLARSVMSNFVPSYGAPSSDLWFACFDSANAFIPSLSIGRLPVKDAAEAERVVTKVLSYDTTPRGEWNKTFMFMTAGDNDAEKADFNAKAESMISGIVLPPPIGGVPVRAYKTSPAIIDGSMKPFLQESIRNGVVLLSYLGHSGGRIWGLDPGSPYELGNTSGRLPFVASVSCNVGAFSEPSGLVLAEDFLLADNRGGIAAWASASLGYPAHGSYLVSSLLEHVRKDSLRAFGTLTTLSRIDLWALAGNNYITIAHQYLTPLLGDPLTELALPRIPDLALQPADLETDPAQPTTADSSVLVKVRVRNYGTTPAAAPVLAMTDMHHGMTRDVGTVSLPQVLALDSASILWHPGAEAGLHTLGFRLSLPDTLRDLDPLNNGMSLDMYIYANALHVLKPISGTVVQAGPVRLVVGAQTGAVTAGFTYVFELDTVPSFDSPFKVSSPPVSPGPVSGEWISPSLPAGRQFYWRTRTSSPSVTGRWVTGAFSTQSGVPPGPGVRWSQSTPGEFAQNVLEGVSTGDAGVGITPGTPVALYCRSLGNRNNADKDYYSILKVGFDVITGLWWWVGNSFMGVRVDPLDGSYVFKSFNIQKDAGQADSMARFINETPGGSYLGFTVVFDGKTNVNAGLTAAMQGLGANQFTLIQPGMSYAFLARKGETGSALEALTTDSAVVSMELPVFYKAGRGSMLTAPLPRPARWSAFHWEAQVPAGLTTASAAILGMRPDGTPDTVMVIPAESTDVSLEPLNASLPLYTSYRFAAVLTTRDGSLTPRVRRWQAEFEPPPDIAVELQAKGEDMVIVRGSTLRIPLTLHNLGYRTAGGTRVDVGVFDQTNTLKPLFAVKGGALGADSSTGMSIPVPTDELSRRVALELRASADDSSGDLFPGNNSIPFVFSVTGGPQGLVDLFADGTAVMDGDYIAAAPKLSVRPRMTDQEPALPSVMRLLIDGMSCSGTGSPVPGGSGEPSIGPGEIVTPVLTSGRHELRAQLLQRSANGSVDTLQRIVVVNVATVSRVLQVLNYPNPFAERTEFTFVLTGARQPDRVMIRVFTVAGRKIREMALYPGQVQIGFNRVVWDGRDNDGDQVANGVYLYQVQVTAGESTESAIGKLARVR